MEERAWWCGWVAGVRRGRGVKRNQVSIRADRKMKGGSNLRARGRLG